MGYKLRRNDSPYDNCSKALQKPLLRAQCKGTEARSYGNFGIADEAQGGYLKTINYLGKHTQHLVMLILQPPTECWPMSRGRSVRACRIMILEWESAISCQVGWIVILPLI